MKNLLNSNLTRIGLHHTCGLERLLNSRRLTIALDLFPEDLSLGLRPIGSLAAMAFWIFCAEVIPFLLLIARDRLDLILGLTVFLIGVAVFFLSLIRLHRQMAIAKHQYVAWARGLYVEAFKPMRPSGTLDALKAQAPLLSAAEALEKRALSIQEWPFDERTNSRITIVVTGAIVATVSRILLRSFGL